MQTALALFTRPFHRRRSTNTRGSACFTLDEDTFGDELMTAYLEPYAVRNEMFLAPQTLVSRCKPTYTQQAVCGLCGVDPIIRVLRVPPADYFSVMTGSGFALSWVHTFKKRFPRAHLHPNSAELKRDRLIYTPCIVYELVYDEAWIDAAKRREEQRLKISHLSHLIWRATTLQTNFAVERVALLRVPRGSICSF